ncbi:NAD-dependent epimerase/dehydratase family protein [Haloparvum sedimenti]|uniref:NAD-dependent epimerase/dehydratase family protein n=1 Tax=Haloparvum sedimenti TaxID=1678448 RepID=UPI00071E8F82|nr:NAD(P)-dependent oxidoreductase [Haloparvum sedimenti]
METVIVTGGLGRSGRWIVDRLADQYEVVCVDLHHPGFEATPAENVDFRAADLADRGETYDLIDAVDPDAVVHWAAIPSPTRHAGGRVFETNVLSAYNVLTAAGRADARVVQASSESAYGFAFAEETSLPDELPITEDHPCRPEDPYGLGKVIAEDVADTVVRKHDISVTSVRPSWIQQPGEYNCRDEDNLKELAGGAGNCWSYVDARDVADLVAAALADPVDGHEAVHAAAADTYLDGSVVDACLAFWGEVPDDCGLDADGDASALSTAKAEHLFDWTPSHTWRDAATADVDAPSLTES